MADKLTISEHLADVLAALKEVTKPYQLGIQLKIDSSELETIEKDYPRDIDRQKTEVIKYWLRNSPDPSWTTLASAVERMGGHARLAQRLKDFINNQIVAKEPVIFSSDQHRQSLTTVRFLSASRPTFTYSLDVAVERNVLLLGKMGHGKSTLGNKMLNNEGCFKINDKRMIKQVCNGSAMLDSTSQNQYYLLNVYNQNFVDFNSLYSILSKELNLVIFVLKYGHNFDENEQSIFDKVMTKWQVGEISALVLTHCENLSEEEREEVSEQFKKDHPSVAELMGKGILAVGFPSNPRVQSQSLLSQRVEMDKKKLRDLIYSCDDRVTIPGTLPSDTSSQDSDSDETFPLIQHESSETNVQNHHSGYHHSGNKCTCCSIL